MGQFKDPELALAKEVILQAQAQTTKWVTMTLVISCVGVMGVTGIMMGVYLSGNLGKGDDSDDMPNNLVMAEAMKGANLENDVAQNHLDLSLSDPKTSPEQSHPQFPMSDDDNDDHQNMISNSKIPVISDAKEIQRNFLASEMNHLNMIGKKTMALPNLPTKLYAKPIIFPPSAIQEAITTEIPTEKVTNPANTVQLPNEVTIGANIRDFTITSNIDSITNNFLNNVRNTFQDNTIHNHGNDDDDESFEFDSPETAEKDDEDSVEQSDDSAKVLVGNHKSEEAVKRTSIESQSRVQSSESQTEDELSTENVSDESSSREKTIQKKETEVPSSESADESVELSERGEKMNVSEDKNSAFEEDDNENKISKETDNSNQSSESNDLSTQDTDDFNEMKNIKPAELDYDFNFEYENVHTDDKFKPIVATSLTLPYKMNSEESKQSLRSNDISIESVKASSDSYDSEEKSATISNEIKAKDGPYKTKTSGSISADSLEELETAEHSFEIEFQTVYSKKETEHISREEAGDASDKVKLSLSNSPGRISSEELSSVALGDESGVAKQSTETKHSSLQESGTSSEEDSESSTEKNTNNISEESKEDIIDQNSNDSHDDSKSDENTKGIEHSVQTKSFSNSKEETFEKTVEDSVEKSDENSMKLSQSENSNSELDSKSSMEENDATDEVGVSTENSAQSKQNIKNSLIDDYSSESSESGSEKDNSKSSIIRYESQSVLQSREKSSSIDMSSDESLAIREEDSEEGGSLNSHIDSKAKGDDDDTSSNGLEEESKEGIEESSNIIDHDESKKISEETVDHSKSESSESSNESGDNSRKVNTSDHSDSSDERDEDLTESSEKQNKRLQEELDNDSGQSNENLSSNSEEQTETSSVLRGSFSSESSNDAELESSESEQTSRKSSDERKQSSRNLEDKSSEETSDEIANLHDESNDSSSKSEDDIKYQDNEFPLETVVDAVDYDVPVSFKSKDSDFYSSFFHSDDLQKNNDKHSEKTLVLENAKTDPKVTSKEDRSEEQLSKSKDSTDSKESETSKTSTESKESETTNSETNEGIQENTRRLNNDYTDIYYDDNMYTDFLHDFFEKSRGNIEQNSQAMHSRNVDKKERESDESSERKKNDYTNTDESQQVDNDENKETQGNESNEKYSTPHFFHFGHTRNPMENGIIHGITNGFNAYITTPRPVVPAADYDDNHSEVTQQGRSSGFVGVSDDQTGGISSWNNGQHHPKTFTSNQHLGLNNGNGHGGHFGNAMMSGHQSFGQLGFSDLSSFDTQQNTPTFNNGNTFSFHGLSLPQETVHFNNGHPQDFTVHENNNQNMESQWLSHEGGIHGNFDQNLPQVAAPQHWDSALGRNEQLTQTLESSPASMVLPTIEPKPEPNLPSDFVSMVLPTTENDPQPDLPAAAEGNLLSSSPSVTDSEPLSSFSSPIDNVPETSSSLAHQDPVTDLWFTGNKEASLHEASRPDRNILLDPQTNYFSNGVQRIAFGAPDGQLNFNINPINENTHLTNNQPVHNLQNNHANNNHFDAQAEIGPSFENMQNNYGNNNHFQTQAEISAPFENMQNNYGNNNHFHAQAEISAPFERVQTLPHSVDHDHDEDSEERDDDGSSTVSNTSSMSSFVQPSNVYRNPFAVNDDNSDDHNRENHQFNHDQTFETTHTNNEYTNDSSENNNENDEDTDR